MAVAIYFSEASMALIFFRLLAHIRDDVLSARDIFTCAIKRVDAGIHLKGEHMRENRTLIRSDTQFWVIKRNVDRVPRGSEVEICSCNDQLIGSFGMFKDDSAKMMLRSKTGFVVATSIDIEDLALLIVENEWYAAGPESLLTILDLCVS